jgi:hypothetical protein
MTSVRSSPMMEAVFSATEGIEYQLRELAKGSSRNLLTWDVPSGIGEPGLSSVL